MSPSSGQPDPLPLPQPHGLVLALRKVALTTLQHILGAVKAELEALRPPP